MDAFRKPAVGHGRHAAGCAAIPVSVFIAPPVAPIAPPLRRRADTAGRGYSNSVLALTTAGAMALTSLAPPSVTHAPAQLTRAVLDANVQLTGVVSPAEVTALVNSLDGALASAGSTVSALVAVPGQTVAGALNAAATVNNVFFGLLTLASSSPVLRAAMDGLRTVSAGGLSRLANTVSSLNATMALTTKQMADLLTTTLTGSLGTVIGAVVDLVNNPFSLSKYVKLADAPIDAAGLGLSSGITALEDLGTNAFSVGNAVVTGVTGQIKTAISAINAVFSVGHNLAPNAVLSGLFTAVHGIVTAPLNALVNSTDGISKAVMNAGDDVVSALADTAAADVHLWLGDGTSAGALQRAINTVGAAPLSISSYVTAVSTLLTAAIKTVTATTGIAAQRLAQIPFTFTGDLTSAGAGVINAFINGTANVVAGLLHAAGVPTILSGISYGVAQLAIAVNNHVARGIRYTLDSVATHVAEALGSPALSKAKTSGAAAVSAVATEPSAPAAARPAPAASEAQPPASKPATKATAASDTDVRKPVAAVGVTAKGSATAAVDSADSTASADSSSRRPTTSARARTARKSGRHSADAHSAAKPAKGASSSTGSHSSSTQQGRHRQS